MEETGVFAVPRRLLRVREVATSLGISVSKTYELLADGRLKSVRIDGARRVSPQSIDEYLKEREAEAAAR